jgi:S1-C subfamily serine protease
LPAFATAGTKFRCPRCSAPFAVGGVRQTAAASAPTPAPAAMDDPLWSDLDAELGAPLGPPRRARRNNSLVYLVGGIGGALVLLLSVALVVVLSGGPEVAEKPADLNAAESGEDDTRPRPEAAADREGTDEANRNSTPIGFAEELAATASSAEAIPKTDRPQEAASEPSAVPTSIARAESTESGPAPPLRTVDLLKLIDPARDATGGNWTREGSSLACPGGAKWSLVVPKPPPAGYRWTIDLERTSGNTGMSLFLIVDGHPVMAMLETFGRPVSGLSFLDGRPADRNDSTGAGQVFHEGRPTTIVCTVDRSSIEIACDGKPIVVWRGSAERLSYDRGYWHELPTDRLAVASYNGAAARIDKMTIEEIDSGEAIADSGRPAMGGSRGRFPPPWARGGPPQSIASTESSKSSVGARPRDPAPGEAKPQSPAEPEGVAAIALEELPEAVRSSKESVCIIEHPLGSGTGFVVGENLVATNAHVVDGAYVGEIECHFSASAAVKCRASGVLYEDAVRDLCLLKVETDQAAIPVVADYQFQQRQKVVIVGNPSLGETDIVLRDAVAEGTMRAVVHTGQCDFYQIDGAVNPGSSGGPALNYEGAVVAVIAMKATERGETEIREALKQLDDSFSRRFGSSTGKGIAFGIPVGDLTRAIEEVKQQSDSAVTRVADRHLANVLLQRMSFVGGINLIKLQLNVPPGVRQQAQEIEMRIQMRQIPTSTLNRIVRVPLVPKAAAKKLSAALANRELLKVLRACESGMQSNVEHLSASEQFDPAVARDFEALLRTVLQTKRYAERPPSTYNSYAEAVNDQVQALKTQILRLEERLDVAKAAYEE